MEEYKSQSIEMWNAMGNEPESLDAALAEVENTGLKGKQEAEHYKEILSPSARAGKVRRRSMGMNLSEQEALDGFLSEINQVDPPTARAGLLEGDWKGKEAELEAMSDEQVKEAYKAQSIKVWNEMGDDPDKWDEAAGGRE